MMSMFTRRILDALEIWAARENRKPLILRGARQVGKTTAVHLFAQRFDQYLRLDLELHADREVFEQHLAPRELLDAIFFLKNTRRTPGRTLLFIDEIQNSPEAVSMMRYFHEEFPDIHVIGAGSLLEVMMDAKRVSFPVGRVEYLYLHPVSFEEFLGATGEEAVLDLYKTVPVPGYAHSRLLHRFHTYAQVGGMPEIVRLYSENHDKASLEPVYNGLLISYVDDAGKYARNPAVFQVLRHAIETAPFEAGKRIKFQGFGRSNYRSREMGEALRTLERAMLIHLLYPAVSATPPMVPDRKKSPRLQFIDTGLLCHSLGLQRQFTRLKELSELYQGIISQHVVGQELMSLTLTAPPSLVFWVREKSGSSAEVDFLHRHDDLLIPVEVKSGKTGRLRSLHQFIDGAPHAHAVRLWSGGMEVTATKTISGKPFRLLNLPYYLAGRLPEYLAWFLGGEG